MKLFLLPVLSWTLAISPIFAQKNLTPGLQDYAGYLSAPVKTMLTKAGFNLSDTDLNIVDPARIENRSAALRLDSTVTYTAYTADGLDSLPYSRQMYLYPQDGVEVIIESSYDFDHWVVQNRITLISDHLGRLVETVAQVYDAANQTYVPDSRIEVFPHGNSDVDVDSFFVYAWSAELEDWTRLIATWNEYNSHDQLSQSVVSVEFFQIPLLSTDTYTYNQENQLILIESFLNDGIETIPAGKQEFEYNNNQLTARTVFLSDGLEGFVLQDRSEYTYTTFNKEETIHHFEWDIEKNDWKPIEEITMTYDDAERLTALLSNIITAEGEGMRTLRTTEYALEHDASTEAFYQWNNSLQAWHAQEKKFYFYSDLVANEDIDPSTVNTSFFYPNPSHGGLVVKLDGYVSLYVYTLTAQLVHKFYLQPGDKIINLSHLPPGIYQVRAKSDEDYFSGKLIIQ